MEDKEKIMADSMAELSRTLASVKDSALLEDFLKALLTPQEYNAVASRWALVRLLDQGMTQRKIAETLGLSRETVKSTKAKAVREIRNMLAEAEL